MKSVTALLERQKRQLTALAREEFSPAKKQKALEAIGPVMAYCEASSRSHFQGKIRKADNDTQLNDAISDAFYRERNELIHKLTQNNPLAYLVDRQSGDSWNGTHDRGVEVALVKNRILVRNVRGLYQGEHSWDKTFTRKKFEALATQDVTQYTRYYSDLAENARKLKLKI